MRKGHKRFYKLLEEIADLHERKNASYAQYKDPLSNLKFCERLGVSSSLGCVVRMGDKWSRLEQLIQGKPDMVGESIKDTLKDMAIYSLLCIILIEECEK